MQRTYKASLLHFFEAQAPESILKQAPLANTLIIDGMAIVQELADKLICLQHLVMQVSSY